MFSIGDYNCNKNDTLLGLFILPYVPSGSKAFYIVSLHCMPSILRSVHDALAMNYHSLCGVASVREDGVALTLDDVIGHCSRYRDRDLSDVLQRRVAAALRQQVGGRQGCQGGRRDEEVFVRQMSGSHSYGPEADAREYVPVSQYHTRRAPVSRSTGALRITTFYS